MDAIAVTNEAANAAPAVTGAFAVDATKGRNVGTVNRQWAFRPDDQKYLSLSELEAAVRARSENCKAEVSTSNLVKVIADAGNADDLRFELENGRIVAPTHWSLGQLCSMVGAPAGYVRKLPAFLAGLNLQHGLVTHPAEVLKAYTDTVSGELRAATSPDYGRIFDKDIVAAVRKVAGNGTGDTRWKVPGMLSADFRTYNPYVDITKDTTTLYASDRDCFMFLVDDTPPIEIGKLDNGNPDLVFRGFYVWNSEVGKCAAGIASFLLRGVCMNRNLWGVEGFEALTIRHTKNGPARFAQEAAPALLKYSEASAQGIVTGIANAKAKTVARNDEERVDFLTGFGLPKALAAKVVATAEEEEGHKPRSIWDMVQGMTAVARSIPHQDARLTLEKQAGTLLAKGAKG